VAWCHARSVTPEWPLSARLSHRPWRPGTRAHAPFPPFRHVAAPHRLIFFL
jgi:hypothetical protein